eukprot:5054659-Pleurochrysis_carterae.AAC.4
MTVALAESGDSHGGCSAEYNGGGEGRCVVATEARSAVVPRAAAADAVSVAVVMAAMMKAPPAAGSSTRWLRRCRCIA